jgi:hypothetical protein
MTPAALADMIARAGGVRPLARLLGIAPSTVVRWQARPATCPDYVEPAVAELLRRAGSPSPRP